MLLKRIATAVSLFLLVSLLGCGGGGGDDVSVTPSVTSLQFSGISGESIASQSITVTLTEASGTVYAAADSADTSVAVAGFTITGGTTAVITVTPSSVRTPGTYQTTVFLRVYRNPNGTDLLRTFTYAVTLTVLPGLSVSPPALSLSALEGGTTQASLAVTVPQGAAGTVGAALAPGQAAAPWLSLTVVGNSTVQVDASAVALPAGVYQRDVEISLPRPTGTVVVRVPLTFTVGVGLVAPAHQTLTLAVDTPLANLARTVNVERGDGAASAWTATSSAPWLALAAGSGTTPGSLAFSVDPVHAADLPQFTDSAATVTISTAGLTPVSFVVTLEKRLPYVASVGPYGITVGTQARIVLGGAGFSQSIPAAALQFSGLDVGAIDVLSDRQLALYATPTASGNFSIGLANASGIATPRAQLSVSEPFSYASATVPHVGPKNVYLHDPVRHAVFALSRSGNALVRYRLVGNVWSVTAMPYNGPLNMAISPDGSRIWMTDQNSRVVEVDPDTLTVLNTYQANFGIIQNLGGVLPVSSDGRLWLPGSAHYFDLLTRSFGLLDATLPQNIEFGAYHGPLDGSLVLISPSFQFTPRPPYWLYEPGNGQLSNPMGNTELGFEPRLSVDGSLTLVENFGTLYTRNPFFALLGQLPAPPATDSHSLMTLTPDGSKILVLRKTYTTSSHVVLASQAIDVYSTGAFAPGSTDFAKTGTIAISTDASICDNNNDCFYGNQYLLPSVDSQTLFWIGNQNMQVFSIP